MKQFFPAIFSGVFLGIFLFVPGLHAQVSTAASATAILSPDGAAKLAPPTVFFRGQSASLQLRNTYGLHFVDNTILLAGLVDSSGYSTGIQQKYQGYILSEVPLDFAGKTLPAGAYGFIAPDAFTVMDLGAHEVLRAHWKSDAAIQHPR